MKKAKQLQFFKSESKSFGGCLLHKKRRRRRPISTKHSLHVVVRSSWAKGRYSFRNPQNYHRIQKLIEGIAHKFNVKIYRQAIVGNHIHLMIGFGHRECYKSFIRLSCGQIASHIMKGQSFRIFKKTFDAEWGDTPANKEIQGSGQQFFQFRPFTRVLHWGKDFQDCGRYLKRNILEAIGFIVYEPRNHKRVQSLSRKRMWIAMPDG